MTDYEHEEWRSVNVFPGYQISNMGNVRRAKGEETQPIRTFVNKTGYARAFLVVNKKRLCVSVHRLVALAFLDLPYDSKLVVNHLSGVTTDNRLVNLEVTTQYGNIHHAMETLGNMRGLKRESVEQIVRLLNTTNYTQSRIAEMMGISQRIISYIMHGNRWREYAHLITPEAKALRSRIPVPSTPDSKDAS